MTYDLATCITAGELRAMGLPLSMDIPDCGWVPRNSWSWKTLPVAPPVPDAHGNSFSWSLGIEMIFTEPFRWIEASFTIERQAL